MNHDCGWVWSRHAHYTTGCLVLQSKNKMAADLEGGATVVRRNRPGTKAKDMYNWPDQDFSEMETVLAGK